MHSPGARRCSASAHLCEGEAADRINSATDNPLVFPDTGQVISGGNFHGQPIAFAMDFLGIGMAEIASISERRIERLVNPQLNDLPAFLSPDPGLQSGMMIAQYVAASLVSENKTLAHPSSVDSIPSSANQEDHVSMGATAARHAAIIVDNGYKVLAIEAICAAQAAEIRGRTASSGYPQAAAPDSFGRASADGRPVHERRYRAAGAQYEDAGLGYGRRILNV